MATEPAYTVLPLSALKNHVSDLFEALKAGTTVYISKHGRIAAAFRPPMFVPEGVAAVYTSPHLELPTISAREIGRQSLSQIIADAAAGLPAIVIKGNRIYGMLTPATAPHPDTVPNPTVVGAKADALLNYQENNPDASIDDVMAFASSLDSAHEEQLTPRTWPLAGEFDDPAEVRNDIKEWREQGSKVEDVVEELIDALGQGIASTRENYVQAAWIAPGFAHLTRTRATTTAGPDEFARYQGGFTPSSIRLLIQRAEQLEAGGDQVYARTGYVRVLATELATDPLPNVGVMWRLGNLARRAHRPAEAALWFRFSLAYDAISDVLEQPTSDESILGMLPSKVR